MNLKYAVFVLAMATGVVKGQKQDYQMPLNIPALLSGNYGELRANHFHSGIDFKTQGVVGKPVFAVMDGYVSRVSVSPWGYGLAIYLTHPNGTTSVYGHLDRFNKTIAKYVSDHQYKNETFSADLTLKPNEIKVKKGEEIARAGNSGSSGGPHLHFEIRNTKTEEPLDPLAYLPAVFKDTTKPKLKSVVVYAKEDEGVVNGLATQKEFPYVIPQKGKGAPHIKGPINAWGEIAFGVKANDYMDGVSNIFGVKTVALVVDKDTVFKSNIDRYRFDETRYLNAWIDYDLWRTNRSFVTKSYVENGNKLRFLNAKRQGWVTIDEERPYDVTYVLSDYFGNTTKVKFAVQGKKQAIPKEERTYDKIFKYNADNNFGNKKVKLDIDKGNLYDHVYFTYKERPDTAGYASIHVLNDKPIPLHKSGTVRIKVEDDKLENKRAYGIASVDKGRKRWIGGTYKNGWVEASIRELGSFTIIADTAKPSISAVGKDKWAANKKITLKIGDNLSGVQDYKCKIDGKFVVFALDGKTGLLTYKIEPARVAPGKHVLEVWLVDQCGNERTYKQNFAY